MNEEKQPVVTDEPIDVQDFRKITDRCRGINSEDMPQDNKGNLTSWTWKHVEEL